MRGKAEEFQITLPDVNNPNVLFNELIRKVRNSFGKKVVILIDEYDAPVLTLLNDEEGEMAKRCESTLARFYGIIKAAANDDLLRFRYVTGITRLVKDSFGSSLNDLAAVDDQPDCPELSTLFGFTLSEIQSTFRPELRELAKKTGWSVAKVEAEMERRYNGYNWNLQGSDEAQVFNPYAISCLFAKKAFGQYWAEVNVPRWLLAFFRRCDYVQAAEILSGIIPTRGRPLSVSSLLESSSLELMRIAMWECGLLTAKFSGDEGQCAFPNNEVSVAVAKAILAHMKKPETEEATSFHLSAKAMVDSLSNDDLESFLKEIEKLIRSVPSVMVGKRFDIRYQEATYHMLLFSVLYCLPISPEKVQWTTEKTVARGRIDLVVVSKKAVYIVELKCNEAPEVALRQIKENGYAAFPELEREHADKDVYLVGVSFFFRQGAPVEVKTIFEKVKSKK